jgi:hypothetical protein
MAQRPSKIDDVKRPEKVTPAASSRPLIVTNRPILPSDPMVVPTDQVEATKPAEPVTRTAKTVEPASGAEPVIPTAPETRSPVVSDEAKKTDQPVAVITEPAQPGPVPDSRAATAASDESTQVPLPGAAEEEPRRDAEAEVLAEETAAQEAKTVREQELEQLIASGKYHAPINALQRKRSRMYTAALLLLAVALAALLLDTALDAGLVKTSVKVPHTHFFSDAR